MSTPRLLVGFTSALAIAVFAFAVAIWLGEWWVLPVALAAHGLGFGFVMVLVGRSAGEDRDKPDPVTEARLEEEDAVEDSHDGSRRREDEPRVFGH